MPFDFEIIGRFLFDLAPSVCSLSVMALAAPFPTLLANLILTCSHALNKVQFESVMDTATQPELLIRLEPHKANKTLSITDTGIGMTKSDLHAITRSRTQELMEALHGGVDLSSIDEFDVGLYSAYLIVEKVIVTTKHNDDEQYIWESQPGGSFTITRDVNGERLSRGTKTTLFLKEDQVKYLEERTVKDIVEKHSELINYPIYLWAKKKTFEHDEAEKEEEGDAMGVSYEWQLINKKDKSFKPVTSDWVLCKVIKDILGDKVVKVVISRESFDDSLSRRVMMRKRILEINPDSDVVEELRRMAGVEKSEENVRVLVLLLFDEAFSAKTMSARNWANWANDMEALCGLASLALQFLLALSNSSGCFS